MARERGHGRCITASAGGMGQVAGGDEVKWRKIAGCLKWAGYENGQHVATIQEHGGGTLLWVDGGRGFQRVHVLNDPPTCLASWKRCAVTALSELREGVTK